MGVFFHSPAMTGASYCLEERYVSCCFAYAHEGVSAGAVLVSARDAAFVHTGVPQGAAAWPCSKRRLFNRPCQLLEQKLGYENYTAPVSDCRLRLPAPITGSDCRL